MTVRAVDLFCGAGGLSTGLALACEDLDRDVELAAVNHWETAIETHETNHPWADHYHAGVENLAPRNIFEPGTVDILTGGPKCTDFSLAKAGQPVNRQLRMAPFHVLDWVAELLPKAVLIENVPQFEDFGPVLAGKPTRNGDFFDAWRTALEGGEETNGLGYNVSVRTLTAADYGDPTTRKRLFVVARRDDVPVWPEPTHSEDGAGDRDPWRTAAEVIDWSERGQSIWTRGLQGAGKRPLRSNTMKRIAEGVRRYGDDRLEPYADALDRLGTEKDLEEGKDVRLTADLQSDAVPASEAEAAAEDRDEPYLVKAEVPASADDGERAYEDAVGLCVPCVKGQHGGSVPRDAGEQPVPTVTTGGAVQVYEPEAFVLPRNQKQRDIHSNPPYGPNERPVHTVTASNHDGHLVTPYLVVYNGESDATGIMDPVPTVTTTDRFALVVPEHYPWGLDVRYRLLQPRELARAQGFPDDYEFAGDRKDDVTAQIGNAVPVQLARALCKQLLGQGSPTLEDYPATTQEGSR